MKELLLELMQNAEENGYPLWDWLPEDVAWEIQAYVDEFELSDFSAIVEAVIEIQKERR
jgi:hypothetical protein